MASMRACHDGAMGQGGVSGLVTGPVFKIAERQILSLAGSIPVRLRHASRRTPWTDVTDPRRRVPRTDVLLADPRLAEAERVLGRALVKAVVAQAQERARRRRDRAGAGRRRRRRRAAGQRGEPAAGDQRDRRRRAHQPRPGAAVAGRGRRGGDRQRRHRRRVRPGDRSPRPPRPRRAGRPGPGGPDRGRRARRQQQRRRAAAHRDDAGARQGDRGQPRRADRDRRRLPAARPDGSRPARGSARSAPPTARICATTPTRSGPTPASCSRCTRRTSASRGFTSAVPVAELATLGACRAAWSTSAPGC